MAMFGLQKISFESRTTEWVAESEEEKNLLGLSSFKHDYEGRVDTLPVFYDLFARSLLSSKTLGYYEAALNFNRRGRLDVEERRYVDAMYDFYFSLETLYAGGAFRKRDVIKNFLANEEMMVALKDAKAILAEDNQFLDDLKEDGEFNYLEESDENVISKIVALRGFLHHHSAKNSKAWHPERQSDYKVHALFMSYLVHQALSKQAVGRMFSSEVSEAFARTQIRSLDGRTIRFTPFEPG